MQLTWAADRTFVWGYSDSNVSISTPDSFIIYSGNVGIGTTNPNAKLEIANGDIKLTEGYGLNYGGTPLIRGYNIDETHFGTRGGSYIFHNSGGSGLVTIKNTGNVGIATMEPRNKLDIGSAFSFHDAGHKVLGIGYVPGNDISLINGYSAAIRLDPTNGGLQIQTNSRFGTVGNWVGASATRMMIDRNGNVGIGTTSPGAKLEVHDDSTGIWPDAGSALKVSDGSGNVAYLGADEQSPWVGSFSNTSFRIAANQLTHVTIQPTGNVGIGTTSPNYKLHVIGDIAYTGSIYDVSDIRLKENITSIENAVENVSSINGIYFNNKGELPEKREVGVIAQEVEKVLPEIVSEDNEGYKSVDYSKLTPLLIEAIKELKAENEELKERILALEAVLQP